MQACARGGASAQRRGRKRGIHLNALGRSGGGVSTKIHVLSDANGLPLALHLTPGQTVGIVSFVGEKLARPDLAKREQVRRRYAKRNCIERMMGFLKQFRRVATRYDKTAESFLSFVQLAAIHRWMRFVHTA